MGRSRNQKTAHNNFFWALVAFAAYVDPVLAQVPHAFWEEVASSQKAWEIQELSRKQANSKAKKGNKKG